MNFAFPEISKINMFFILLEIDFIIEKLTLIILN